MTTVTCPHCSHALELPDEAAGKSVVCARCEQTFMAPSNAGTKSGELATKSGSPDTGITDSPPATGAANPDARDVSLPRERRDIAEGSSLLIPLLVIGGIAALGLCVCGAPAAFFLMAIPIAQVEREAVVAEQAQARRAAEQDQALAKKVMVQDAKAEKANLRGFAKGQADAKDAIAKGTLILKEYPPIPAPAWHSDYVKLLKEKCDCDYQVVDMPKYSKEVHDEVNGWNDAMKAELRQRPGGAIVDQLNEIAQEQWKERVAAEAKKKKKAGTRSAVPVK